MEDARFSIITGVWYDDTIEIPAIVKEAWKKEDENTKQAPRTSSKKTERKRKWSISPNKTSKRTKYVNDAEFKTLRITPRRQSTPKKIKSVVIKPKPPTELAESKAEVIDMPILNKAAKIQEEATEELQQKHCVDSTDEFLLDLSYMDTLTDMNFL